MEDITVTIYKLLTHAFINHVQQCNNGCDAVDNVCAIGARLLTLRDETIKELETLL